MKFLHRSALLVLLFVGIAAGYLHEVGAEPGPPRAPTPSERFSDAPASGIVVPTRGGGFWRPLGSTATAPGLRLQPCLWTPDPAQHASSGGRWEEPISSFAEAPGAMEVESC